MAESSPKLDKYAQMARAALIGALREHGQAKVAASCGIAQSTLSTWFNENVDRISILLATTRQKVVPVDDLTVDPGEYRFLRGKAIEAMQRDAEDDLRKAAETGSTERALRFDDVDSIPDGGDEG